MTDDALARRGTREVLEDHLRLRRDGNLEADVERNYATDVQVVSLMTRGRGHDCLRAMAGELEETCPTNGYDCDELIVEGSVGMLVWSARCPDGRIAEAVDSFVVERGRITVQTVHYHLRRKVEDDEPTG